MGWTDHEWIPVARSLPSREDGPPYADGAKIGILALTVGMMISGVDPDPRGFHLETRTFDDDDEGRERVMFWAPLQDEAAIEQFLAEHAH